VDDPAAARARLAEEIARLTAQFAPRPEEALP
jgi:hypothetical protein